MEKDHRLFLKNLPPDISNDQLKKLFVDHGQVINVDIKEKVQSDGSRIAFVNLTTTDRQLNACFQAVNGKVFNGNAIRVEVAKESYLDRLKREREEAVIKIEPSKETKLDWNIETINIKVPVNIKTKATKRIYNFDKLGNVETTEESPTNELGNARDFAYDPALEVEVKEVEEPWKKPIKMEEREIPEQCDIHIPPEPVNKVISQSEIKRLASVKKKRQTFRVKEQLISRAIQAMDSRKNNKIVFSDDIEKIGVDGSSNKRTKCLFNGDDDDDDDDRADWGKDKFQHDKKRGAKLAMSMNNLSRDKRFAIDDRFLDDDDENALNTKAREKNYDDEMDNETQWQLEILQDVLGKPIKARNEKFEAKKQNKMVRYDPTASGHQVHELEMTNKTSSKAHKRKLAANSTYESEATEAPIPVSSQVFYSVSDNLADTLNVHDEFSLLKTFGTAAAPNKNRSDEYNASANAAQGNWQSNFDAKNPFKYESSDDESPDPNIDQLMTHNVSKINNHTIENYDSFFFIIDDRRFLDAQEFFNKRPSDAENFNDVRRELKMIVRKKVRNNTKKNTTCRNKKIERMPKSR